MKGIVITPTLFIENAFAFSSMGFRRGLNISSTLLLAQYFDIYRGGGYRTPRHKIIRMI